ncbi:FAD-dependent oxidoreductase [Paenibacillus sp. BJ-4]|uniref:FAD-dependent oxidoreductase n=1 Tax=Paenibacillus sp. BJ-4 TaxID=2878097 RepID=UPI00299009F5|nr:FAD-dependent oxidoreductase [Paenibacillus sp. BJ-4]
MVNPATGKEHEYEIKEAEVKKKVMVVGGEPVGMEAAIVAAKRGHDVTIYEKNNKLGGQWLLAAINLAYKTALAI